MIEPMFIFIILCNLFAAGCCGYNGHKAIAIMMTLCAVFNLYCGIYLKHLKDKDNKNDKTL